MVDFVRAMLFPLKNGKKFLIGLLIAFLASRLISDKLIAGSSTTLTAILAIVAIIFTFMLTGYHASCSNTAVNTKKKEMLLPSWKHPWKLFAKGFLTTIILIVYSIPLVILTIIFLGDIITNLLVTQSAEQLNQSLASFSPEATFIVFILLLTLYIIPFAVVKYSKTWKFSEAFQIGDIFRRTFKMRYFNTWVLTLIYSLIITILINYIFVNLIPIIGSSVANAIISYGLGVTVYTIFGELYKSYK